MKKIAMILVAMILLIATAAGASAAQNIWYELSANDTVLTVRLPGAYWNWEISNPDALELITQETENSLAASFMSTAGAENNVSLILRYAVNEAEAATEIRVMDLNIDANNVISVNSVLERSESADWYEMDAEANVLVVRLPGEDWEFEIVEPNIAELINIESNEDAYIASFMPTMEEFGMGQLIFNLEGGKHSRAIDIFVIENGEMVVQSAETFDIVDPADAEEDTFEFIEAEPVPVEFRTVNVTGGTVNLRTAPTTESDTIAKLSKGDNARYLNQSTLDNGGMEWHKISFGGKTGWISAKYAKLGGEGYVRIVNGSCNMRTQGNLDGEVLGVLKKDSTVKYLGEGVTDVRGVDWYKVSANGKTGWISSQYAVFTAAPAPAVNPSSGKSSKSDYKYVQISGGKCNMRKSANKDSERVTILQNGTIASYLGEKQTDDRGVVWYKVSANGKKGWVSSKYAKLTNNGGGSNNGGNSKQDTSDMRLVLNPNRYNILQVRDIYSQDGNTIYVVGNFGTTNSSGEPCYFDSRKDVTMKLVPGAEVMLPSDPFGSDSLSYVSAPYMWFNDARKATGGSFSFYATFSMNESGELRSLVYKPMY